MRKILPNWFQIKYETLTGEEIENIINKNLYPKDKIDFL